MVTSAPGTTAPRGSDIVPRNDVVEVCGQPKFANNKNATSNPSDNTFLFMAAFLAGTVCYGCDA
jgi:hypothetical protein